MVQSALRRSCVHFGAVLLVSAVVVGSAAWAQSPPGGGTILRQIDPPSSPPVTPTPQIKLPIETRPALPNSMDMTVDVRGLRITGSTAFSENQLMPLVADALGSALNIQELDAIADRITYLPRRVKRATRISMPRRSFP